MAKNFDSRNVPDMPDGILHTSEELQEVMYNGMYIYPIEHRMGSQTTLPGQHLKIVDEHIDNENRIGPRITVFTPNSMWTNEPRKTFMRDMFYGFKCVALSEDGRKTAIEKINAYIASDKEIQHELDLDRENTKKIFSI